MPENKKFDLFLSFADEDKDYARQLYEALQNRGIKVWCSLEELRKEPSHLIYKINDAICNSKYGLILVSTPYLKKESAWTIEEMSTFFVLEEHRKFKIIPVWYQITFEEVKDIFPFILGSRLAYEAKNGLHYVVDSIVNIVEGKKSIPERSPQETRFFNQVWVTEKPFGLMGYRNPFIGTLQLSTEHLEFFGERKAWFSSEKKQFRIKANSIKSLEHTKMSGDFSNNWVKIIYNAGQTIWLQDKSNYLAFDHGLGNLLGGSKNLYKVFQLLYKPSAPIIYS